MKNNNLMGIITKSLKSNELIKGPMFSLTVKQTNDIIIYLRSEGKWNSSYINCHALVIGPDILFNKLKIFHLEFKDDNFNYDFDLENIDHFFGLNPFKDNFVKYQIALNAYFKGRSDKVYTICLGYFTNKLIFKQYPELQKDFQTVKIEQQDENLFFKRKSISDFYEFDFDKFDYFLERVDIFEYIFHFNELCSDIDDSNFFQFHHINN